MLNLLRTQLVEGVSHQLRAQARALVQRVDSHIPDSGGDDAVSGAAGKAHQLGQALIVPPQTHQQQAVLQGPSHPPQGPPAPTHRIAELLELDQVDFAVAAEHQRNPGARGAADAMLLPVEMIEPFRHAARPDPLTELHRSSPIPGEGDEGGAPLLVGVHGWLLAGRLWQPLQAQWQGRHDLWTPDLPGFGREPRPLGLQPTLQRYGRWLAEAVAERAGGRPVVLIGHSLGGSIALHAAERLGQQVRGLVLVGFGGGIYQPRPFALVRRSGALFLRWRPTWLAELPAADAIASPLRADLHAARGLLACSMRRQSVVRLPALVNRLQPPSLWIVGSNDQVMEPRYVRHLAGFARRHSVVELAGAGHLPMRQQPIQLAATIDGWLSALA